MNASTAALPESRLLHEDFSTLRERSVLSLIAGLLKSECEVPYDRAAEEWLDAVVHSVGGLGGALCLRNHPQENWHVKIGRFSEIVTDSLMKYFRSEMFTELRSSDRSDLISEDIGCLTSYPMIGRNGRIGTLVIWFPERFPSLMDLTCLDLIVDSSLEPMESLALCLASNQEENARAY